MIAKDPQGGTVSYFATGASWPAGFTINSSGVISGITPYVAVDTSYELDIIAYDILGIYSVGSFSYVVSAQNLPPVWVTPFGVIGSSIFAAAITPFQFNAYDPQGRYLTYAATGGFWPAGLTLSSSGLLSGTTATITATTTYQFEVTAYDTSGLSTPGTFSYVSQYMNRPPVWSTSGLVGSGFEKSTITPVQLVATSPNGNTISYSVANGSLTHGLHMSSSGLITGTLNPASINATVSFAVVASDGIGGNTPRNFSYLIEHVILPPVWHMTGYLGSSTMNVSTTIAPCYAIDPQGAAVSYSLVSGAL
jgi:hypothetical protein